jgi:ribosomal protein L40E
VVSVTERKRDLGEAADCTDRAREATEHLEFTEGSTFLGIPLEEFNAEQLRKIVHEVETHWARRAGMDRHTVKNFQNPFVSDFCRKCGSRMFEDTRRMEYVCGRCDARVPIMPRMRKP